MKKKNKDLKWYAFYYDWNGHKLERTNVLGPRFTEDILKRIKRDKINTYEDLKEGIKRELMYYYWSKAEYEVLVTDLFPKDYEDFCNNSIKIDIWYQLEPNLDRIVEYVIKELNIEFK